MPYINAYIHLIWSTKNRKPCIDAELKEKLLEHIQLNGKTKDIYIDTINCVADHIHILISLKEHSIPKAVQLIKGESSHWVNKSFTLPYKFEWQEEYIAVSVSPSNLTRVRSYIENQEAHHKKKSFMDEYNELLKEFGIIK
jgi:REP element-mobilizing transposase RayT